MKSIKLIAIIAAVVFVAIGWVSVLSDTGSELIAYNNAIKTAESLVGEGLYQRAILEYKEALTYNSSENNWTKMLDAYEKRYDENTSIMSEYIDALNSALELYPKNVAFVTKLADMHMTTGDMTSAYNCLSDAIEAGVKDETIAKRKQELQYYGELGGYLYDEMLPLCDDAYTVKTDGKWTAVDSKGDSLLNGAEYISPSGDGVRVYSLEKDYRLIRSDGMVLGIFEKAPTEAGVFSEGLIPAKVDGLYAYYDSYAKKQFGDYEKASAFQNGKAAVKTGKGWIFIDTNGKQASDIFADVILDSNGKYLFGDVVLAAKKAGSYAIFDKELKQVGKFTCDDMDVCANGGAIAFKKGEKWGFVNTQGEVLIQPTYEGAKSYSCGLAAVCKDNSWGFIDSAGNLVIDYRFSDADYFNESGACMVKTGKETAESKKDKNQKKNGKWQLFVLELGLR